MSQGFTRNPAQTVTRKNSGGSDFGPRRRINLIEGTNVTITMVDDGANDEIDVTIAATGGGSSPLTTKGDLYGFTTVDARIPVGTNDTVLKADSVQAAGVIWEAVAHSELTGVTSDLHHPQLHQAAHQSGGGDALTGNLDATARTSVSKNSAADVGARRTLNFIEGSNITLTIADDAAGEEIDITIAATGGGASPLTTKGDLFGFTTVDARIPVGANGTILQADSAEAAGVGWDTTLTGVYTFSAADQRFTGDPAWTLGAAGSAQLRANTLGATWSFETGNTSNVFTERLRFGTSDHVDASDISFFDGAGGMVGRWRNAVDAWELLGHNITGGGIIDSDRFQISDDVDTYIDQTAGLDTLSVWAGGVELFRVVEGTTDYVEALGTGILVPDGSAATPSIRFTNDTNLGIYRIAADELGFSGNGSLRARLDMGTGGGGLRTDQSLGYAPASGGASLTDATTITTSAWTQWGTEEVTFPWPASTPVTVMAWGFGYAEQTTGSIDARMRVMISFDGGTTWTTAGLINYGTIQFVDPQDPQGSLSAMNHASGTPTGDIWVRAEYWSANTNTDFLNGFIMASIFGDI